MQVKQTKTGYLLIDNGKPPDNPNHLVLAMELVRFADTGRGNYDITRYDNYTRLIRRTTHKTITRGK